MIEIVLDPGGARADMPVEARRGGLASWYCAGTLPAMPNFALMVRVWLHHNRRNTDLTRSCDTIPGAELSRIGALGKV